MLNFALMRIPPSLRVAAVVVIAMVLGGSQTLGLDEGTKPNAPSGVPEQKASVAEPAQREVRRPAAPPASAPIGGIGIMLHGPLVEAHNGVGLVIQEVTPDGSAAKAGLRAGMVIVQVDDEPLANLDPLECMRLLRGPVGSFARVEVSDPKKGNERMTHHLMRRAFPPAAKAPAGAVKPNLAVRLPDNPIDNPALKGRIMTSIARYFGSEAGADEAVRKALTDAGILFEVSAGEMRTLSVPEEASSKAKEALRALKAKGSCKVFVAE
jgi:hypothetical protein